MDGSTYNIILFVSCKKNENMKTCTMPNFLKMGQTQESSATMNPRSTPLSAMTPPTSTQPPARHGLVHDTYIQAAALPNFFDPFFLISLNPDNPCTSTCWHRFMRPAPWEQCSPACLPPSRHFHVWLCRCTFLCCCHCCYQKKWAVLGWWQGFLHLLPWTCILSGNVHDLGLPPRQSFVPFNANLTEPSSRMVRDSVAMRSMMADLVL